MNNVLMSASNVQTRNLIEITNMPRRAKSVALLQQMIKDGNLSGICIKMSKSL